MQWMEEIKLRIADKNPEVVEGKIMKIIKDLGDNGDMKEVNLYHSAVVNNDVSVHLYWDTEGAEPQGSATGLCLVHVLREYGLISHSVWVDLKRTLEEISSSPKRRGITANISRESESGAWQDQRWLAKLNFINQNKEAKHMYGASGKEAKEFVQRAKAFYKKAGKAIALAEFTNPKGPFIEGEQYIFVLNPKGTMLSHGVNEKYIGQDFVDVKDSDGRSFIREIVEVADKKGSGFVDYKWYNPVTKEDLVKHVYFEKVDDLILCSGVYKEMWKDLL